ncbi:type II toxin-antitoxin system HicB family antitoxin [Dolichospermum sp. ST_sed1]|nr:type II toxin-antitoxin system HicB family antitoxin [Dolichospermum sp. ST_sed1]MDD1425559.1 type II toxin-antitoxin system HicB family antitoxin [Dolichospermum sp. ST_sed9]MDD1432324.1 type II toxin-antitoxin system HicB family antitoxin [Dolichospermum sp. ST_sed6]MDD1441544.1 type II toxin-antitoxin system HicB family antitoxin [Dolichospermum sp. ST_sed3]MDD1447386.1 type II toxin-antitoxin system HicB family antitoxin [Dolichospermum sp. ST_sed8]MDD1457207.1 type II toxin-antitoxin s
MKYKGYESVVEFDDEAEIFHGEIINIRDVITFQGSSVEELKQAFQDSVDDYLEFCKERGEEPDKPFSGKFVVRIDPELHKVMTIQARQEGKSLNSWIEQRLSDSLA